MNIQLQQAISILNSAKPNPNKAFKLLKPLVKKENAPWSVFHYMAVALIQRKQHQEAAQYLQKALRKGSDEPETYHLLSVAELELENYESAEKHAQEALQRRPDFFKAWLNLGSVCRAQAKLEKALVAFKKANQLDPKSSGVAFQIAQIYGDLGNLDKAIELYDIAWKMDPEYDEVVMEKAILLQKDRRFDESRQSLEPLLKKNPNKPKLRMILAETYRVEGKYEEAISLYEDILSDYPRAGWARVNYASALQETGRFNESEPNYLKAFRDQPGLTNSLSNYLMGLHYNPKRTREEIFEAHKEWDRHFSPKQRPERPEPADKNPERTLRIGFISGSFFRHPVGWMITLALENLPKDRFEIYCYSNNIISDKLTQRIHAVSDSWKSIVGYSDEVVAGMIREDDVDILVELSGHAAQNRLRTVALEPAPVIVKWVGGLFNTSGIQAMDYLITDRYESPEGEEPFYTEKLVRLPDDYICFLPPDYAPDPGPLPAREKGYVTFGCFNNPTKINNVLLEKWASLLRRVPDSRLFLKSKQYDTPTFVQHIVERMGASGISEDRLLFEGDSPHNVLLKAYYSVDIALDPWPYSGGLSTCEALWMGVPVVTLPGPTFAGRHSTTHLINAGLPEMVAATWDEYVDIAVGLASDLQALAGLRARLRDQVAASSLCDGERFGAALGKAFRAMWHAFTEGRLKKDAIAVELPDNELSAVISDGKEESVVEIAAEEVSDVSEMASEPTGPKEEPTAQEDGLPAETEQRETDSDISDGEPDSQFLSGEALSNTASESNGQPLFAAEAVSGENRKDSSTQNPDEEIDKIGRVPWKRGDKDNLLVHGNHNLVYSVPDSLEVMSTYVLLEQGQWYDGEVGFVMEYLQPGMQVLDIGAGFGAYALGTALKVGPTGKVFAFEPVDIMRKHLDISKMENGTTNLEVSGRAFGSINGKMGLSQNATPELTRLEAGGNDIQVVTLDSWWDFEGNPQLDMVKIDVNGQESDVLKGAERFLAETSAVFVIAASESRPALEAVVEYLGSKGYTFFDFIARVGVLSLVEDWSQRDAYAQNVIAVKEKRVSELKESGWIHDESIEVNDPEVGVWKKTLKSLPWTESLFADWEKGTMVPANQNYYRALDYICAAEAMSMSVDDDADTGYTQNSSITDQAPISQNGKSADSKSIELRKDRSKKAILLLVAAQELISKYHAGDGGASAAYTLVRILNTLGKRDQAVAIMQKLMQGTKMGQENLDVSLPFLLPIPSMDNAPIRTEFNKWLMVRTLESWIFLKDLTTYLSAPTERRLLEILDGNPEVINKHESLIAVTKSLNDFEFNSEARKDLLGKIGSKDDTVNREKKEVGRGNNRSVHEELPKLFKPSFWFERISPAKAKKIVEFSEKFNLPDYTAEILNQVIIETKSRLEANEDDNIAFFIQVHALLALNHKERNSAKLNPELAKALKEKSWEQKTELYNFWFDCIKYKKQVEAPEVTAIIISNRFKLKTIENLKRLGQQLKGRGEVIFVNNGIEDSEFDPLFEYVDTYVKVKRNSGAYLARNLGALFAKGDYLLFVDDDGIPDEGLVDAHVDVQSKTDIVAARGVCYSGNGNNPPHYNLGDEIKPAPTYLEGNTSYEATAFFEVGGWGDYILFGHGGMELSYRLIKYGIDYDKLIYTPYPKLKHEYTISKEHLTQKIEKQRSSFLLINNLYVDFSQIFQKWKKKSEGMDISSTFDTPSEVVKIDSNQLKQFDLINPIYIPRGEVHRINNIFYKHEYRLPKKFKLGREINVFDVGANVGIFSLYANRWAETVNLFCFEPNPQVHRLLKLNTKGLKSVDLNFYALGKKNGELKLYQHPVNTGQTSTSRSFEGSSEVKVPVYNSGEVISKLNINEIDVLKIDTEGAEVSILIGLKNELNKVKIVMAEYHTEHDRKQIEKILHNFILYSAHIEELRGVGTVKYVNMKYL